MLSKLEKYLFYLFLFAIPFQTRNILWYPSWRFDEWQSISIYGTDILLVILFIFWAFSFFSRQQAPNPKSQIPNKFQLSKSKFQNPNFYLFLFVIISLISIKNSSNLVISWYQLAKLIEFIAFYFYISRYALAKFGLVNSALAIFSSGLFQAIIAIIQFLKKSSIGLKYLGESVINADLPGIASFYLPTGEKIIRAYGTTPHPNVLAGFLLLVVCSMYYALPAGRQVLWIRKNRTIYYLLFTTYPLILFAFFTTFSRVGIFVWFVCLGIYLVTNFLRKNYGKNVKEIVLLTLVVIILFNLLYFPEVINRIKIGSDDQAIDLRIFYAKESLNTGINFFGVGIGNFVGWLVSREPLLPNYAYQPVHNIYLLIYSETGLLGLAFFVLFLFFLIKNFILTTRLEKFSRISALVLLGSFLFIGFFDHFLWTLQQGRIILWTSLGLLAYLNNKQSNI